MTSHLASGDDVTTVAGPENSETHAAGRRRAPLFRAARLVLSREDDRAEVDAIAAEVRERFAADLAARPSRHVYVHALPESLRARVARIRELRGIRDAIEAQMGKDAAITPLAETDELYICHYNKDFAGDHGLFARHYDGNLRFVPIGAVVRALVYVRSAGDYEVVFGDSGVAHRFRTYDVALLDFHRELHWVRGAHRPGAPDRIVLKLNYLVLPPRQRWAEAPLAWVNLVQFRIVKAAMEYSKSPWTIPQRLVGWVCNAMRLLNNAHPALPHVAIAGAVALVGAGVWVLGRWLGG